MPININLDTFSVTKDGAQVAYEVVGLGVQRSVLEEVCAAQTTAGVWPASGSFDCQGQGPVGLTAFYDDAADVCKIRLEFLDASGVCMGFSEEYELANPGILVGAEYPGELLVLWNYPGAGGCKVHLVQAPATAAVTVRRVKEFRE